jgi:hypothetical protein
LTKKPQERIYLTRFVEAMGWSLRVEDAGEAPDFTITLGARRIGIEVVQVFADQNTDNSEMRQDESHRLSWLGRLSRDYYDAGGAPAHVQLQVDPGYFQRLGGRLPLELRDRILQRLRARVARMDVGASLKYQLRGAPHGSMLASMWIRRLPESFGRYSRWRLLNDAMAWVPRLMREHLDDIVEKKSEKLAAYRQRAPEVVLLVVADGFLASGLVRYDGAPVERRGFDAVYLLHYPKGEVQELVAPARPWS